MSKLVKRRVKGKQYYYLEESFGSGKGRVRESHYIGAEKPDRIGLREHFEEFKRQLSKKGIDVVVPPLTDFITHVTAVKLDNATRKKTGFLDKLTAKQRCDFIKREKITFIADSNAIEGSTLDFSQTMAIVREGKRLSDLNKKYVLSGDVREQEEAISLSKCLDMYGKHLEQKRDLTEELILQWHYVLLRDIKGYEEYAGIWRPVNVFIRGSLHRFPDHTEVRHLMLGLLEWCKDNKGLIHPVELAAKFHTKFTTIHPFADGNGRMARLLMNYILQLNEFPFTNIPLGKRSSYMRTQASGNVGEHKPFTKFLANEIIVQNEDKSLNKVLKKKL